MNKLVLLVFSVLLLVPVGAQNVFADPTGDQIQIEVLGGDPRIVTPIVGPGNEYEGTLLHIVPVDITIDVRDGEFSVERFDINPFILVPIIISDLDWLDAAGNEIPGRIVSVDCGNTLFFNVGFTDDSIFFEYIPGGGDLVETCTFRVEHEEQNNNQVIGGEIIPIQQTSLFLAGAQSFSWMIPVTLSILGIGLFIVSRRIEY